MRPALTGSVAVVLIAAAWWLASRDDAADQTRPDAAKPPAADAGRSQRSSAAADPAGRSAPAGIRSAWNDLLDWLDGEPPPDAAEVRRKLLELRNDWAETDPHVLAETIALLLREGRDAPTGLRFRVGLHGMLDEWPSARVFLLDALAPADPDATADLAREILATTGSPEEYALALRPLARAGLARAPDAELLGCFQTLLARNAWHQSPGFAESLDLARTIGTPETAAALLAWSGNADLRSMALHEFAAEHPEAFAQALPDAPNLTPAERAPLMARLDPASPDQAAALDRYLADPSRKPEETQRFLKLFPLRSATTGHRLYSRTPSPYTADSIGASDRAALTLTRQWLARPDLAGHHDSLRTLEARLVEWVGSNQR
jgi:hypothetical protein